MTRTAPQNTRRHSQKLSWLLRHGAGEARLAMDEAGWSQIADVCAILRCTRDALDAVVADNNKQRYQIDGARIRAAQGHSLKGMPITCDALEASWSRFKGDDPIWHGTNVDAIAGIAGEGIHSGERSHVHLAATLDSHVGKRANVHVMLGVSPEQLRQQGQEIFVSPNGVVLVRRVPAECITTLRAFTRRARDQEEHLKSLLGL